MLNDNDVGMEYLQKLNGDIHILRGNHDTNTRITLYEKAPNVVEVGSYAQLIKYGRYHFYISHYPTMTSNLENNAHISEHVINLYGHTHQKGNFYQDIPFMYHVGLDSHDCYPVEITQIIEDIKEKVNECYAQL
jgi:calcineurin-like phosphoesterase family protein